MSWIRLVLLATVIIGAIAGQTGLDINVKDMGAVGNGVHDDGDAFQDALDKVDAAGGGSVFLPRGTYLVERTLSIGDNTRIYGMGSLSVVKRSDHEGRFRIWKGPTHCEAFDLQPGRVLFINKGYNCGNEGIVLENFKIDGSLVTTVPLSVTIAFSAVKDTHVRNMLLEDVPQDAIFFRNGGVDTSVTNTTIDGFNMRWGNGGGVNVEMWANGNVKGRLRVENNTIIARGPAFCSDQVTVCDENSDCKTGECKSEAVAITARTKDPKSTASLIALNNEINVGEGHHGIVCLGCTSSDISGNEITPLQSASKLSGRYVGILAGGNDLFIRGNVIEGTGDPNDGRGILVEGGSGAAVHANLISGKNLLPVLAALEVRGQRDFAVNFNRIIDIRGAPAMILGSCDPKYPQTGRGHVFDNVITVDASGASPPDTVGFRRVTHLSMLNNKIDPKEVLGCGPQGPLANLGWEASGGHAGGVAFGLDGVLNGVATDETLVPAEDPFTITMWVKPEQMASGGGGIFGQFYNVVENRFYGVVRPGRLAVRFGGTVIESSSSPPAGDWSFVAFRRTSEGGVDIFLNGRSVASGSAPNPVDDQATTIGYYAQQTTVSRYAGSIDGFHVFTRALDTAEIERLAADQVTPASLDPTAWSLERWVGSL